MPDAGKTCSAALAAISLAGCTLVSLDYLQSGEGGSANGGAGGTTSSSTTSSTMSTSSGAMGGAGGSTNPPTYGDCVLASGPAIYLRMSNASTATEPNLGTLGGSATYVGDVASGPSLIADDDPSASFAAMGSELVFSGAESLFGGYSPFSIEVWLKAPPTIDLASVFRYSDGTNVLALDVRPRGVPDGMDAFELRYSDATSLRSTTHFLDLLAPPEPVHHVVAVYQQTASTAFDGAGDADDLLLYVDGSLVEPAGHGDAVPLPTFTADIVIGLGFFGLVDDLAIYDRALDATEVKAHADAADDPSSCL
ncbi:MAG: LamG-like jellyroll fold domain-containing protein [Polyangiaceae bacterium]